MNAAPRVAVVDTGSGNLRSVEKALESAGAQATVTSDPEVVARADRVVVPGQGAFGACVAGLDRAGGALRQSVLEAIGRGTPYLGICLGLQVLFQGSDENPECRGLGILPGRVVRFAVDPPLKVPHMGWNLCSRGPAARRSPALRALADGTWFYFVHSYYPAPADPADVALETDHGGRLCVAVARDNVLGCQFHPEKSQEAGLSLLSRFVSG
jgi:imidazole glycerol-phosphate synthase subunit HisH